ncbi:MAG: selenite/tellurite reduction operon protein ExtJ [Desulfurivibrionaceae bacterium]
MSKKMISLAMAVAFVAGFAAVSFAGKCKVTAVEGTKVTVDCAGAVSTVEGTAKVGDMVMVKDGKIEAAKKKKAIEGC